MKNNCNTKTLLFKRMNSIGGMPLDEAIITKSELRNFTKDLEPLNDSDYYKKINQKTYNHFLQNQNEFDSYDDYLKSLNRHSPADNAKEEKDDNYYEIKLDDMVQKYEKISKIIDGCNDIPAWIQDKLSVSYQNANAIYDYYRAIKKENNINY